MNGKCRAIKPPAMDACGAPADWAVTFNDGDVAETCRDCALALIQTAQAHGTRIQTKKLEMAK